MCQADISGGNQVFGLLFQRQYKILVLSFCYVATFCVLPSFNFLRICYVNFCHILIPENHFNHGSSCSWFHHPYKLPGQYPVQEWAFWSGTYGKQSMMLCVMWNLIILFKALQRPKVEMVIGSDSYYGHKSTACLCTCFITHLFACDGYYRSGSRLTYFVAHPLNLSLYCSIHDHFKHHI